VASEGEAGKAKWCWEAHGRARRLQLTHSGPTWPQQAGGRRRAAPRGGEVLLPVGYCSADSELHSEPDSVTWWPSLS